MNRLGGGAAALLIGVAMAGAAAFEAAAQGALQAGQAAAAAKPDTAPIKKVFPYLDAYLRLPPAQRDRFTLAYRVQEGGKPPVGLKAWVVQGGVRSEVAFAPDGRVTRLPTAAMLADKTATVVFNRPESAKLGVNMALETIARPAAQMSAAEIRAALEQANAGIRRAAGVAGFAVPRMGAATFRDAGSGEVVMSDGRRAALPVQDGHPLFVPAAWPAAQTLVLARTPSRVALGPAPKPRKG